LLQFASYKSVAKTYPDTAIVASGGQKPRATAKLHCVDPL
jgi:hypothetical protein